MKPQKNYIDERGNYHNVENLTLTQIHDRASEEGYRLGWAQQQKGEWIKWDFKTFGGFGNWEYKCSNCEKVYGGEYNFCPNCGASMRKEGQADE